MIGREPKPWPPVGSANSTRMDTAAAAVAAVAAVPTRNREAPSAPSSAPASAAVQAPSSTPAPASAPPVPPSETDITLADMAAALDQVSWAEVGAAATERLWAKRTPSPSASAVAAAAAAPNTAETGAQTGGGSAGRTVSPRPWQGAPDGEAGPPPLTVPLHRGTMTSPPPDDADAKVQSLADLFPTVSEADRRHILEQCGGDLQWATNMLLDTNLETLETVITAEQPVPPAAPAVEEATSTTESPLLPATAGQGARPKQPLLLTRQDSDSGPDVIVESSSSDSETEAARTAAEHLLRQSGLQATTGVSDSSSSSSSGVSTPSRQASSAAGLSLQLPPQFAYKLQEMFGPTAFGGRTGKQQCH